MAFLLSRCIGLVTPDIGVAAEFYQNHFDMVAVDSDTSTELIAGPLRLFLDPGQPRPLVFELTTDDHQEARHLARQFGFEELVWRGPGQSCLVRDPFGLVLNVHEDRTAFLPMNLDPPEPGFVKPCLGAMVPSPNESADFYAEILQASASRLPDGSYIVDSGSLRIRFREGKETAPTVWLRSNAPVEHLTRVGCQMASKVALTDPFGISWSLEAVSPALCAVCCPL